MNGVGRMGAMVICYSHLQGEAGVLSDHIYSTMGTETIDTPRRRSDSESDLGRFMNPGANYQQSEVIYIKPECFDGKDDWKEYMTHFENCAELGRWHGRIKLMYLSASLKGQARTFYMSLPAEDKGTYTALVYSLGQRFGSTKHQNRWL